MLSNVNIFLKKVLFLHYFLVLVLVALVLNTLLFTVLSH